MKVEGAEGRGEHQALRECGEDEIGRFLKENRLDARTAKKVRLAGWSGARNSVTADLVIDVNGWWQ